MAAAYEYQELPTEGYIRILTLYPAAKLDDPICGHLRQVPLGKSSNYAALSYSWGMDKDGCADLNRTIDISGRSLAITQNLFEGLRRIRDKFAFRRLWIDAVCIDQSNIPERNAQVAQMAKIYSCTTRLVIWLGEGESEEEDEEVLKLATLLQEQERKLDTRNQKPKPKLCLMEISGATVDVYKTKQILRDIWFDDPDPDHKAAIAHLNEDASWFRSIELLITIAIRIFIRRYWRRRWVVQELYHSRKCRIEIRWGPCSYGDLDEFQGAFEMIIDYASRLHRSTLPEMLAMYNTYGTRIFDALRARSAISRIGRLKRQSETREMLWHEFIRAFVEFSSMECADGRDRLFALSSLSPLNAIKADYSMTTNQVCISFASTLVREGYFLAALELVENESIETGVTRDQILPSWVHDLRVRTSQAFLDFDHWKDARLSPDATILELSAHYVGIVEMSSTGTGEEVEDDQSVVWQDQKGLTFRYSLQSFHPDARHFLTGDAVFLLDGEVD